ncbi:CPBP family intramembrane glutamic endopeptidase [Sphingomicrobium marinum]|uniref:CPBP family intramembrane glutamic endopeptidase n=1 Tax=Sphingomicrobium marinum TaxID=1227950 RepID=UPI00223FFD8C|nr:CPBP family intramembrane glutamic endopeptidase [Sphingomicrobium marinum]
MDDKEPEYWPEGTTAAKAMAMLLVPQAALVVLAFVVHIWSGVWPLERFALTVEGVVLGIVAAIALIVAVYGTRPLLPGIWADLDHRAGRLFAQAPFKLSWPIILMLSAVAGIGEEIVFRGALQGWLETVSPVWSAIIAQAIIFAALHPISRAYVVYVLVIGIALGTIYVLTGNLLVTIIAHFLNDVFALERLRRLATVDRPDSVAPAA